MEATLKVRDQLAGEVCRGENLYCCFQPDTAMVEAIAKQAKALYGDGLILVTVNVTASVYITTEAGKKIVIGMVNEPKGA